MIHPGDKVKIINEIAEGIVQKILSSKVALVRVDDFDYEYSIDKLLKIDPGNKTIAGMESMPETIHPRIKKIISEEEHPGQTVKKFS